MSHRTMNGQQRAKVKDQNSSKLKQRATHQTPNEGPIQEDS